jgi:hypothetical protein
MITLNLIYSSNKPTKILVPVLNNCHGKLFYTSSTGTGTQEIGHGTLKKYGKVRKAKYRDPMLRIRITGSGAFLPPGSGIRIRDEFFPDPGSDLVKFSYIIFRILAILSL